MLLNLKNHRDIITNYRRKKNILAQCAVRCAPQELWIKFLPVKRLTLNNWMCTYLKRITKVVRFFDERAEVLCVGDRWSHVGKRGLSWSRRMTPSTFRKSRPTVNCVDSSPQGELCGMRCVSKASPWGDGTACGGVAAWSYVTNSTLYLLKTVFLRMFLLMKIYSIKNAI